MSDETKTEDPIERVRALLTELFPPADPVEAAAQQRAAEVRADARINAQLAANEERFAKELAFRERMVAEQLRAETAATILAALIDPDMRRYQGLSPNMTDGDRHRVSYAVALADALRAELARKP
jgi:hypothetical protein